MESMASWTRVGATSCCHDFIASLRGAARAGEGSQLRSAEAGGAPMVEGRGLLL
jgi:hypothetical protein